MKRNNFLFFLPFAVVLLTLSACTVADEFDVFHRDGKTYITSLRVHSGVPDAEELGTRTFFDTRDDFYGTVYWEDRKTIFEGKDPGEGTFGPDHLYFFNANLSNYKYTDSISDYFCAEQYNDGHYYKPNDPTKHKWATFNLQLRTPPLQVYKKENDPTYYGYYCPALATKSPGSSFDMSMHDQKGQSNAVLRSFLRKSDVLWLEHPLPAEGPPQVVSNKHRFKWTDEENQDIYFSHIFSLVEVDIKRNDYACTVWEHGQGGNKDPEVWSSRRRVGKGSYNGMNTGNESSPFNRLDDGVDDYPGNFSYLPLNNVDLIGGKDAFLKSYSFNGTGEWYCEDPPTNLLRCTRTDEKQDLSLLYPGNENNVLKYYFLVYSFTTTSTLAVDVQTPRYEPDSTVSEAAPFNRRIEFTMEDNFKFEPGKYYKIVLDLCLPDSVSTATDAAGEPIYYGNGKRRFLDIDWKTNDYHLLAPAAEMKNIKWGIKFNSDGTIPYEEKNN